MIKPTPNPPETPDISPYESLESKKFHEAAERALDHHFKPRTESQPKRETGLFSLAPGTDAEALMANASEDLLSISAIACDLADDLTTPAARSRWP